MMPYTIYDLENAIRKQFGWPADSKPKPKAEKSPIDTIQKFSKRELERFIFFVYHCRLKVLKKDLAEYEDWKSGK